MDKKHYILDGKTPVPVGLMEWAEWFGRNDRSVAKDEFEGVVVSTVFLGLDHNFFGDGPPLLFETMVFTDIEGGGRYVALFHMGTGRGGTSTGCSVDA